MDTDTKSKKIHRDAIGLDLRQVFWNVTVNIVTTVKTSLVIIDHEWREFSPFY